MLIVYSSGPSLFCKNDVIHLRGVRLMEQTINCHYHHMYMRLIVERGMGASPSRLGTSLDQRRSDIRVPFGVPFGN